MNIYESKEEIIRFVSFLFFRDELQNKQYDIISSSPFKILSLTSTNITDNIYYIQNKKPLSASGICDFIFSFLSLLLFIGIIIITIITFAIYVIVLFNLLVV